ncbi:MAG: hypothetical protein R2747_01700 [Pyrinomonadaceae bacterium]
MKKKISIVWMVLMTAIPGLLSASETRAQYEEVSFPVPKFDWNADKPGQRETADRLKKAYQAMQSHLCGLDGNPTEEWKGRYRQLLVAMTALEYEVVINDAGKFAASGGEKDEESKFYQHHQQIISLLEREIGETQFSKDFFREQLENYQRRHNELTRAAAADDYAQGGRAIFALGTALAELDAGLGRTQMKYRTQIDGRIKLAFEALSGLYRELIFRGTSHINQYRIENSAFALVPYSPDSPDPYLGTGWDLAELGKMIAKDISPDGGSFTGSWLKMPSGPAFSREIQDKMRGGCRKADGSNRVATGNSNNPNGSPFQGIYKVDNRYFVGVKIEGENINVGYARKRDFSQGFVIFSEHFIKSPRSISKNIISGINRILCPDADGRWIVRVEDPFRMVFSPEGANFLQERKATDCTSGQPKILDTWITTATGLRIASVDKLDEKINPVYLSGRWRLITGRGAGEAPLASAVTIKQRGGLIKMRIEETGEIRDARIEEDYLYPPNNPCIGSERKKGFRYRISEDRKTLVYERGDFLCNGGKIEADQASFEENRSGGGIIRIERESVGLSPDSNSRFNGIYKVLSGLDLIGIKVEGGQVARIGWIKEIDEYGKYEWITRERLNFSGSATVQGNEVFLTKTSVCNANENVPLRLTFSPDGALLKAEEKDHRCDSETRQTIPGDSWRTAFYGFENFGFYKVSDDVP